MEFDQSELSYILASDWSIELNLAIGIHNEYLQVEYWLYESYIMTSFQVYFRSMHIRPFVPFVFLNLNFDEFLRRRPNFSIQMEDNRSDLKISINVVNSPKIRISIFGRLILRKNPGFRLAVTIAFAFSTFINARDNKTE